MTAITSSGASETDSARKRTSGSSRAPIRDAAAVGHVDVEQHDVGLLALDQRDGLVDGAGLADDLDAALELAAHARAEQRVVVDQHDAPHSDSSTSVPAAGLRADLGAAAVALHPADDRLAHAAAVGRHGGGVEARAAVADEHLGSARRTPRRRRRSARRPANFAALRIASRAAAASARVSLVERAGRRRTRPRPPRRGRSSISVAARTQRAVQRVGRGGLVVVEPGAQLALLAARELRDLARDRRRGAGSAPASAAPSRAGARRPRRAPARGCAAVRSAVSACAIRSHHGPNSMTLPASSTITGKANDCTWPIAGSARATSTAPTIISAAPTRPRFVVAMPLRITITPARDARADGQRDVASRRPATSATAAASAPAPRPSRQLAAASWTTAVGSASSTDSRRRHRQVGQAVERDADPAEDRQQDERDPHVLDVDAEVPRDARADARELAVLGVDAPGCRRRLPWAPTLAPPREAADEQDQAETRQQRGEQRVERDVAGEDPHAEGDEHDARRQRRRGEVRIGLTGSRPIRASDRRHRRRVARRRRRGRGRRRRRGAACRRRCRCRARSCG